MFIATEKVSIIVPVYNVATYLHRCVDSILNQTYQNLEIILVNDGSPDNCGAICERYREKDERVRVIHKENGGLSDARNAGMKLITGEFTMFVDSDDWIEKTMVEKMVHAMKHFRAEIVQAAYFYAYDDKLLIDRRIKIESEPDVFDKQRAMYELIKNEAIKNFAWGKLYKTKLIKDIPFKKGVLFEDVYWQHLVIERVNKYVSLHEPFYYYYQRESSIVGTFSPKHIDFIRGLLERHRFIEKKYEAYSETSLKIIARTCLNHYDLLFKYRKNNDYRDVRKEIERYVRSEYKKLKVASKEERNLKRCLTLFRTHPLCYLAYRGWSKLKNKRNVREIEAPLKQVNT